AAAEAVTRFLIDHGYCKPRPTPTDLAVGFNRYIAQSDAELALVNVEDLWGETRPQNVPGTSNQYPNWRHKLALTMSEITGDEHLAAILEDLARLRSGEKVAAPSKPKPSHKKSAKRKPAPSKR
ncbi:MAG: 4-alpha-glucanotransferase, partial [Phycisphaerales bacterium]